MSLISKQNSGPSADALAVSTEASSQVGQVAMVDARPRVSVAELTGRALFGAFLLVLLMSPFEAGYPPLGRFLWATYTNLEATIFLMAAVWALKMAVDPTARLRLIRTPLLLPILALIGASVVSTFFGEYKAMGPHFIYRLIMGMLVYLTACEVLNSRRRLLTALAAFVTAGSLSAGLGLLEYAPWINMEPWLKVFKPQPTTVGGMLRLSGTFEYANGAAIYFEMVLPVLLGFVVMLSSRRGMGGYSERARRLLQIGALSLVGVVTMALILTFSRAAWAGTLFAVTLLVLMLIIRGLKSAEAGGAATILRPLGLSALVIALAALYITFTHPLLLLRLTAGENDRSWYRSSIEPGPVPTLKAGQVVTVPVTLRNLGPMTWQSERTPMVHLSYHWANVGEQTGKNYYAVFEGDRTVLPHDVGPGQSVTVNATLQAPLKEGEYYLEWDLVQEYVAWFEFKAGLSAERTLHKIAPAAAGEPIRPPHSGVAPRVSVQDIKDADTSTVPRQTLWRVAFDMFRAHPLTGVGPDGFRNLYGKYAGRAEWNRNIYTNNTYIEMFTNLGLLGGLAFLLIAGLSLWRARRILDFRFWSLDSNSGRPIQNPNAQRAPEIQNSGGLWVVTMGAAASLVAFFLHGLADYFLFATPFYVVFWFLIAATAVSPSRVVESKE